MYKGAYHIYTYGKTGMGLTEKHKFNDACHLVINHAVKIR